MLCPQHGRQAGTSSEKRDPVGTPTALRAAGRRVVSLSLRKQTRRGPCVMSWSTPTEAPPPRPQGCSVPGPRPPAPSSGEGAGLVTGASSAFTRLPLGPGISARGS